MTEAWDIYKQETGRELVVDESGLNYIRTPDYIGWLEAKVVLHDGPLDQAATPDELPPLYRLTRHSVTKLWRLEKRVAVDVFEVVIKRVSDRYGSYDVELEYCFHWMAKLALKRHQKDAMREWEIKRGDWVPV